MAIVAEAGPILCPCCASRAPVIIWSPGQVVGTGAPMLQIVPQHTSMRAELLAPSSADYPRHLAGRLFSVISHGDVEGAEEGRPAHDRVFVRRVESSGVENEEERSAGEG